MHDDGFLDQLSALSLVIPEAYPQWRIFRKSLTQEQRTWQVFSDMLSLMVITTRNVRKIGASGGSFNLDPPEYTPGTMEQMKAFHFHGRICLDIRLIVEYGALLHNWGCVQAVEMLQQFLDSLQLDRGRVLCMALKQLSAQSRNTFGNE
jgi:hypothetical protein